MTLTLVRASSSSDASLPARRSPATARLAAQRVRARFGKRNPELFDEMGDDVALAVLIEAAFCLMRVTMHLQAIPGGFQATQVDSANVYAALSFQAALKESSQDLDLVVASRHQTQEDEVDFSLLRWMRDHASLLTRGRKTREPVGADTPFVFGLPLGDHRPTATFLTTFDDLAGRRLQQGCLMLEALMPEFGAVRAQALVAEVLDKGSRLSVHSAGAWLSQPRNELGGRSIEQACSDADGFLEARRLAQSLWLQ